jgi:hypothetical protein
MKIINGYCVMCGVMSIMKIMKCNININGVIISIWRIMAAKWRNEIIINIINVESASIMEINNDNRNGVSIINNVNGNNVNS